MKPPVKTRDHIWDYGHYSIIEYNAACYAVRDPDHYFDAYAGRFDAAVAKIDRLTAANAARIEAGKKWTP